MGGLGLLGLWLFLLVVVAVSILLALGAIWLANRGYFDEAGREDNSALSPFLTWGRPLWRLMQHGELTSRLCRHQCICCRSQLDRRCAAYWTPFADNRRSKPRIQEQPARTLLTISGNADSPST